MAETASVDESKREEALFRWLLERDEIASAFSWEIPLRGMSEYVESFPAEERRALSGG